MYLIISPSPSKELLEDDGAASKVRSQWDHKGDLQEGGHVKDLHKAVQQLRNVPEKELGMIAHVVKGLAL